MLLVLFGMPGAGKTFIGNILRDKFGFYFYDIDDDIPPKIKRYISKEIVVPEDLRKDFFENIVLKKLIKLQKTQDKLVMSQALVMESVRKLFVKNFPHAKFILINAKPELRELRLDTRKGYLVNKEYAKKIDSIFEKPEIEHFILENNKGEQEVIDQLKEFIKESSVIV